MVLLDFVYATNDKNRNAQLLFNYVYSFMPKKAKNLTVSLDGKTICSTNRIEKIESPLHIINAQISELRLTFAQYFTDDKSNDILAVQELLKTLKIKGHIIVADVFNCQKKTVKIIVKKKQIIFFV